MDNTKEEDYFRKAKSTVYNLLKFRLRSEHELRDKLESKDLPVSIIDQTIKYFRDIKLIDDTVFAQHWTVSRLKKPFGLNRIRLELIKKGIDQAVIQETLQQAQDQYDELTVVSALAEHRIEQYKNIDPVKIKQRLYGYLLRRGFSTNIIRKVIEPL